MRNDYKTALKFLDEIIALNFASSVAERNRRAQIATLWATQLYNSGIRQINAGYSAAGQSFLEEAASIESNPTELAKINRALTALRGGARKAAAPQTSSRNANDEREWTYQQLKVATSRNDKSQSLLLIERLLLGATEEEASRLRKLHESIERGFVSPFSSVPPLKNINGFGTTIYGDSICIVALFIPIFWLGRYKVEHLQDGRYSFQGKRRLQNWQVIFNWCVAVGTVVLVIIFNVSGSKNDEQISLNSSTHNQYKQVCTGRAKAEEGPMLKCCGAVRWDSSHFRVKPRSRRTLFVMQLHFIA